MAQHFHIKYRTQAEWNALKDTLPSNELTILTDANANESPFAYGAQLLPNETRTTSMISDAIATQIQKVTLSGGGPHDLDYATHNNAEVHVTAGSTVNIDANNFTDGGTQQNGRLWIYNDKSSAIDIDVANWTTAVSEDGDISNDLATDGTLLSLPRDKKALIFFDEDTTLRATVLGVEVTASEFNALSNLTFLTADDGSSTAPNSVNLGALADGIVYLDVAGGTATPGTVATAQGSLIIGDASADPSELAISGTSGAVLESTGTTAAWGNPKVDNVTGGAADTHGSATLDGSGTVTVSTTAVASGSTILITGTTTNSGDSFVDSIVDGTSFDITASSGASAAGDTVYWLIIN